MRLTVESLDSTIFEQNFGISKEMSLDQADAKFDIKLPQVFILNNSIRNQQSQQNTSWNLCL